MERDDGIRAHLDHKLRWDAGLRNRRFSEHSQAEEFARLATLRSLKVTLLWTYRRPKLPRMRKLERVERRQILTIDVEAIRHEAITHWRENEATQHLADIVEGHATL